MPINPEKAKNYPGGLIHSKEWKAFRMFILFRAANRCKGTPQHPDCRAHNAQPHPETGGKVVLTIAHMDHDESHADPERCRALCQRCHNKWDAPHRQKNAANTRRRKSTQIDNGKTVMNENYKHGAAAGDDVNLSRPIENGGSSMGIIPDGN